MPNKNYKRGASFEYERVKYHKDNGAIASFRSAGSHSPIDVVAVYQERTILEQLKRCEKLNKNGAVPASTRKEMFEFMKFADGFTGTETRLCFYVRVDGKKEPILLFST